MCCLFGLIDYRCGLSVPEKNRVLSVLAGACEARGTDATGIAYNSRNRLCIFKRPVPGHLLRFHVPGDAWAVMGHTRMTTQGSAKRNCNNHPFLGNTQNIPFALAHNGVLYNDGLLRKSLSLPWTKIETDSYVAVQLIEQQKALSFDSLRYMAEQVEGSFTFTVLDGQNRLYIVKGENPLCLYHFPTLCLYLYASTEDILERTLSGIGMSAQPHSKVKISCGEILRIGAAGKVTRGSFDDSKLVSGWYDPFWRPCSYGVRGKNAAQEYLEEVKSVASAFGYTPEAIDRLATMGFSAEELEEFLYCGEL